MGIIDRAKNTMFGDEIVRNTDKPVNIPAPEKKTPVKKDKAKSKATGKDNGAGINSTNAPDGPISPRPQVTVVHKEEKPKRINKPRKSEIETFETWDDENENKPREIVLKSSRGQAREDEAEVTEKTNDNRGNELDPFNSLSLGDSDEELWDPLAELGGTADSDDKDNGVADTSNDDWDADSPQPTAFEGALDPAMLEEEPDFTEELQNDLNKDFGRLREPEDYDQNAEDEDQMFTMPSESQSEPTYPRAYETPIRVDEDVDNNDFTPASFGASPAPKMESMNEIKADTSDSGLTTEELIQKYTQGEKVSLADIIPLNAFESLSFARESDGYNRGNVDAMLGYVRLSLSKALSRVRQAEETNETLANKIIESQEVVDGIMATKKDFVSKDEVSDLVTENRDLRYELDRLREKFGVEEEQEASKRVMSFKLKS